MASSASPRDPSEEPDPEFIASLAAFHAERGTPLETQARVNGKQINLHKLFNTVVERGGYDMVSAEKLAWRKVGQEFGLGTANAAAYAFALKTVYYKNLASYEIKTIHNKEPPPKEILENLTAKGGDLLNRTVENFRNSGGSFGHGQDSDVSGDEARTPKEEKMDIDEPGSGGRTTRGLRQAPPQRVLFQPDVTSSRQTRHTSGHLQSPQPSGAPTSNYNYSNSLNNMNLPQHIANYEPRPPMPLTLRSVTTPGNNPHLFKEQQRLLRDRRLAALGRAPAQSTKGMMEPGRGFDGPNIYVRTLQGLRSPLPQEQNYALHHLVKISHERGDKYKFEAFPNLAESLIEYALRVSSLFYDVKWEVSYFDSPDAIHVLDGINGTPDILQRIQSLRRIDASDGVDTEMYTQTLTKVHEAGLTIRNLALLEDNALYLAELPQSRDFLAIVLSLPASPDITELKHYVLDIAEQVTRYWSMDVEDPVYRCLLAIIDDSSDRGMIYTALRAISRISMNLEKSNVLRGIPISVLRRILDWTLLEDDELVNACLDFLYQFTAIPENVAVLLSHSDDLSTASFIAQLTRLLQHRARRTQQKFLVNSGLRTANSNDIAVLPDDLLREFLRHDEPLRSTQWLKAVFEEDSESEVTQIALWQAYQARFSQYAPEKPLLQAADFIKNVSIVFTKANAQIVAGANNKFIIKGIRPRRVPADMSGRPYSRCLWTPPGHSACGQFFLTSEMMFDHIAGTHLGIRKTEHSTWDFSFVAEPQSMPLDCYWAGCRDFTRHPRDDFSILTLGMHVKLHLSNSAEQAASRQKFNRTLTTQTSMPSANAIKAGGQNREAVWSSQTSYSTAINERGDAAGLPLNSLFVLRNIARNIPKAVMLLEEERNNYAAPAMKDNWVDKLFSPLREQFLYVVAHNFAMSSHVTDLLQWIDKGSA